MLEICKTENCKKRVLKNNLCVNCYNLYLQENILNQLTILNNLISSNSIQLPNKSNIKTTTNNTTFIPTIETNTTTINNNSSILTTTEISNVMNALDKLKSLNLTGDDNI